VKVRPWSAVLTVPVERGQVYFKALPPGLEQEVALTSRLAAWFPGRTVPVLAADEARGWMLLPDAGPRLRDVLRVEDVEGTWSRLLADYAEMQIEAASRVGELLAVGVLDRRLARLPELFDHVIGLASRFSGAGVREEPQRLTGGEFIRLERMRPALVSAVERLAALGLAETVEHDDLHDGNVLISRGRPLIFDWGDACISHPFFSLRVALLSTRERFGLAEDDAVLERLRDAYLCAWSASRRWSTAAGARDLSSAGDPPRVLSWDLAIANASAEERAADAVFVAALLRELLETPLAE
jgi:hypothetical protein